MITEIIRYQIPAAQAAAFETAYREAAKALDASSHCLRYELLRCEEEPEFWTLLILWTSREGHLEGFRQSAEFQRFLPLVRPFMPMIQEMRHYGRVLVSVAGHQPGVAP